MSKIKAFPDPLRGAGQSLRNQTPEDEQEGMDLRDYFAENPSVSFVDLDHNIQRSINGPAPSVEIPDSNPRGIKEYRDATGTGTPEYLVWLIEGISKWNYMLADGMMKAREQ